MALRRKRLQRLREGATELTKKIFERQIQARVCVTYAFMHAGQVVLCDLDPHIPKDMRTEFFRQVHTSQSSAASSVEASSNVFTRKSQGGCRSKTFWSAQQPLVHIVSQLSLVFAREAIEPVSHGGAPRGDFWNGVDVLENEIVDALQLV